MLRSVYGLHAVVVCVLLLCACIVLQQCPPHTIIPPTTNQARQGVGQLDMEWGKSTGKHTDSGATQAGMDTSQGTC